MIIVLRPDVTDAQLDAIFGARATQALVFRGMQRAFVPGAAVGVRGTIQYLVGGRPWLLRIADCRLTVTPWGQGLSQGGQSLADDGLALDLSALADVEEPDSRTLTIRCQGGARWRAVIERCLPKRLLPRVLAANLSSIYLASKYAVPHMVRNRSGSVVNTASIWGLVAADNSAAYAASKAGW